MDAKRTASGWVLRLDPGEEIGRTLTEWAVRENVRAGSISGIGAVGDVELGYFERERRDYVRRTFPGDHEILALTGNFSERDGQPFPHLHLVLSGPDFVAHGGHLFRGVITITCEIQVIANGDVVRRRAHDALGVAILDPGGPEAPE